MGGGGQRAHERHDRGKHTTLITDFGCHFFPDYETRKCVIHSIESGNANSITKKKGQTTAKVNQLIGDGIGGEEIHDRVVKKIRPRSKHWKDGIDRVREREGEVSGHRINEICSSNGFFVPERKEKEAT